MRLGAQFKTQNSKFLTRTASAVRHALFHRFVKKTNLCSRFSYFICIFAMSFRVLLFYSCSAKIRGISDMV